MYTLDDGKAFGRRLEAVLAEEMEKLRGMTDRVEQTKDFIKVHKTALTVIMAHYSFAWKDEPLDTQIRVMQRLTDMIGQAMEAVMSATILGNEKDAEDKGSVSE